MIARFRGWLPRRSVLLGGTTLCAIVTLAHGFDRPEHALWKRPDTIPFPADNPYTPEKATLGKMLFFDTRLSRDRNLSCASCHNPSFGWEVPFDRAIGAGGRPLGRHAPTVLNLAWSEHLFWDGRAADLEAQARGPIEADVEMDLREIASRAPYMHNGALPTLEAVVAHYVTGGVSRPSRSALMHPRPLSSGEIGDLVAFLRSLSSPQARLAMPNLPAR